MNALFNRSAFGHRVEDMLNFLGVRWPGLCPFSGILYFILARRPICRNFSVM